MALVKCPWSNSFFVLTSTMIAFPIFSISLLVSSSMQEINVNGNKRSISMNFFICASPRLRKLHSNYSHLSQCVELLIIQLNANVLFRRFTVRFYSLIILVNSGRPFCHKIGWIIFGRRIKIFIKDFIFQAFIR